MQSVLRSASGAAQPLGRRHVAWASGALGSSLAVAGLIVALRGAPWDASSAPVIIASLIVARAIAGATMVGFGWGLIRLAERLLDERPVRD